MVAASRTSSGTTLQIASKRRGSSRERRLRSTPSRHAADDGPSQTTAHSRRSGEAGAAATVRTAPVPRHSGGKAATTVTDDAVRASSRHLGSLAR